MDAMLERDVGRDGYPGGRVMGTISRLLAVFIFGIATSSSFAQTRFMAFTFENDFFAGYDKHYTNGMQAAYLADLQGAPGWLRSLSDDRQAVIALGQRIYTPTDTDARIPDPRDRPYAGWIYAMGDLRSRATPAIDHLTVAVGMLGPASGARQTQNGFHRLLDNGAAEGWDTQVRNRATLMVGYERAWPALMRGVFANRQVDLSPRIGASVGTPLTYADVGAVLRYGSHLPSDIPVTHISLGPPRDGFRGTPQFGWYVWAGLDARAVAYNSFIDARTFSGGPQVSRRTLGHDVQVGFAFAWPRARVGFTMVQRSKEFKEQQGGSDRFGQLALSFAF